jgi:hypothetical protein
MWLMIAIPSPQGVVAGVFKKKFQLGRFHMAVAEHYVGFALMA